MAAACIAPTSSLTPPRPPVPAHPPAAASAEAELHQEFAGIKSRSPPISRQGLAVGRAAGSDMVLEAPSTSQHHARLHQCGEPACRLAAWLAVLGT